jgi:tetratricopeptide (TPR) repeat protein
LRHPDHLAGLELIEAAREPASKYYAPLLASGNLVLEIGAWCSLLDRGDVGFDQYPDVLALCGYGAIRGRAFRFFEANWEHGFAARVAATSAAGEAEAEFMAMRAELLHDGDLAVAAQRQRFLATGRLDALIGRVEAQERAGGWKSAAPLALEALLINPHEPTAAHILLRLLHEGRDADGMDAVISALERTGLHPFVAMLYSAAACLNRNDPRTCLERLDILARTQKTRADVAARARPLVLQLHAEASETLGDYRQAYAAYSELNAIETGPPLPLTAFENAMLAAAALEVPPLPPDVRVNHFVMTGFPRSGTTLLENALDAHPAIETFEELPSRAAMQVYLDRAVPLIRDAADAVAVYTEAREKYYGESDRRRHKPAARVLIDKLPMRSAEAAFLKKLFPDKKYIFSIRHPFDVVLSCFKQNFGRNVATEHFRRFDSAVRLYDFTMDQWFGTYSMDDPQVHYLRYDDLVTDFDTSVRGVLGFLGLDWDEQIREFAALAEARSGRTPSYQKVRQGLALGVQSSWRKYGFLFQSAEAKPLYRWAEFFGYPTR